jgi:NADH-quinone oxidoreductase subunit A
MLREYLPIVIFLGLAIALGIVLILAAVIIAVRNPDPEKVSAYRCEVLPRLDPLHHL